ncbi:MAG TPA: hypothetical protein VGD60_10095 [Candidatus Acidoferrales bacterium]
MKPKDVAGCAALIAAHPVIGPRYGSARKDLGSAWLRLLGSEAMTTAVFEEVENGRAQLAGVGVGVFVHDEFVREIKTRPQFWIGPELVKRVLNGNSPVLSDHEVREANSGQGLNELVWETLPGPKFAGRTELYHLMGGTYIEIHRGFRLKEMITSQAESPQRLQWALDAGGLYWDPWAARYVKSLKKGAEEFAHQPHVVGITRELEFGRPGSWVGSLFSYHPPRFYFSGSEQRLLIRAISDRTETNAALAKELGVSLPTVKKMWLSIYDRVAEHSPELMATAGKIDGETKRGKEKRRRLLAYLQDHPEELRPVMRRGAGINSRPAPA